MRSRAMPRAPVASRMPETAAARASLGCSAAATPRAVFASVSASIGGRNELSGPSRERGQVDGLHEKGIGTELNRPCGGANRAYDQDTHRRIAVAKTAGELQPVHVREQDRRNDQVRR